MISRNEITALPFWLQPEPRNSTPVISTRLCLGRNITKFRFPLASSLYEKKTLFDYCTSALTQIFPKDVYKYINFLEIEKPIQEFYRENRIATSQLVKCLGDRGVVFIDENPVSVLINDEDHIRFQAHSPGFYPNDLLTSINNLDNYLGKVLHYAFDERVGFLTANPMNCGSLLHLSCIMHMPGMVLSNTIDQILTSASQLGFAVQGVLEGQSDICGNLFEFSYKAPLNKSEAECVLYFIEMINQLIDVEHIARKRIFTEALAEITDKIWRCYGILKYCHLLTLEEVLNLTSAVRLGIELGIVQTIDLATLNTMILLSFHSHLELFYEKRMDEQECMKMRAGMVKQLLPEL